MSTCGKVMRTYTKSGLKRYEIEIAHDQLPRYKLIKDADEYVLRQKARVQMASWDQMWEKQLAKREIALRREQKIVLERGQKAQERKRKVQEREQKAQAIEDKKNIAEERTEQAKAELAELGACRNTQGEKL